jgi:hypothetical protein
MHLGTPSCCAAANQDSKWLAKFKEHKKKLVAKRLEDRKPTKPGQVRATIGQMVKMIMAGVPPSVYTMLFESQDHITEVIEAAEAARAAFKAETGQDPLSGEPHKSIACRCPSNIDATAPSCTPIHTYLTWRRTRKLLYSDATSHSPAHNQSCAAGLHTSWPPICHNA